VVLILVINENLQALRTIALAYTDDANSNDDLILVAVFGIEVILINVFDSRLNQY
jgi:hypothetical protein